MNRKHLGIAFSVLMPRRRPSEKTNNHRTNDETMTSMPKKAETLFWKSCLNNNGISKPCAARNGTAAKAVESRQESQRQDRAIALKFLQTGTISNALNDFFYSGPLLSSPTLELHRARRLRPTPEAHDIAIGVLDVEVLRAPRGRCKRPDDRCAVGCALGIERFDAVHTGCRV